MVDQLEKIDQLLRQKQQERTQNLNPVINQEENLEAPYGKAEFNVRLPSDILPDFGGIQGGIGYNKKGSQENFGVRLNTSIPIGDNLIINPSASFESSSNQRQVGDGLILDENKQAIGAVIGGDFYLDDSGTSKLWARVSGGRDKILNEFKTPGNTIVTEDGGSFTKWDGGVDLGKLGINIGDRSLTYTLGNNGQFYINPDQVGVQFNIPLGGKKGS